MSDLLKNGLDMGLSEAEKEDLAAMIKDFKDHAADEQAAGSDHSNPAQLALIKNQLSNLGSMLAKLDKRMDIFYEVVQLLHQKSEITADALAETTRMLSTPHND